MRYSDNVPRAVIADTQKDSENWQNASRVEKPLRGPFGDAIAKKPPPGFKNVVVPTFGGSIAGNIQRDDRLQKSTKLK